MRESGGVSYSIYLRHQLRGPPLEPPQPPLPTRVRVTSRVTLASASRYHCLAGGEHSARQPGHRSHPEPRPFPLKMVWGRSWEWGCGHFYPVHPRPGRIARCGVGARAAGGHRGAIAERRRRRPCGRHLGVDPARPKGQSLVRCGGWSCAIIGVSMRRRPSMLISRTARARPGQPHPGCWSRVAVDKLGDHVHVWLHIEILRLLSYRRQE